MYMFIASKKACCRLRKLSRSTTIPKSQDVGVAIRLRLAEFWDGKLLELSSDIPDLYKLQKCMKSCGLVLCWSIPKHVNIALPLPFAHSAFVFKHSSTVITGENSPHVQSLWMDRC